MQDFTMLKSGSNGASNTGELKWYIQTGSETPKVADWSSITTKFSENSRTLLTFYYSTDAITRGERKDVQYIYRATIQKGTTDRSGSFALQDTYDRRFLTTTPEQTSTLTSYYTNWNNVTSSPQATWTWNGDFTVTDSSGNSLSSGSVADKISFRLNSGTGTITATYVAVEENSKSYSAVTDQISVRTPAKTGDNYGTTSGYLTWKGDYTRTGNLEGEGPQTNTTGWEIDFIKDSYGYVPLIDGSPVISGNNIYFSVWGSRGMASENVQSVDGLYSYTLDGTKNWKNSELSSRGAFTIFNNRIYGGTDDGKLFCADISDNGKTLWTTDVISAYPYTG